MEAKIISGDYQSKPRPKPKATPAPAPVLKHEVEENDGVLEKNDGLRTPTSTLDKIQPILTCPPAPRKPKAASVRKRKGSYTELRALDLSNDVLSLYPPALLADFSNKVKKARRDHQDQHKENICSNINHSRN